MSPILETVSEFATEPDSAIAVPQAWLAIGATLLIDAVGIGDATPAQASETILGQAVLPLSPVHPVAAYAGGDWEIGWTRRSRAGWAWNDGVDAPLGEEQEQYRIDLKQGGAAFRSAIVAQPAWTYDAAAIAADTGAGVSGAVMVEIRQAGTHGAGRPATLSIII